VSSQGDIYIATGNGSSNSIQDFDEGNAVVELSPLLRRIGFWAPSNWVQLNDADWDLGSAGPIQVPGTSLLFVAGKPATNGSFGYLMAEQPLGGIGHGAYTGAVCTSGGAFGADASDVLGSGATARTLIFVPCGGGTVALQIDSSSMKFHRIWSVSEGSPNGSVIVAGGVVWAVNWSSGQLFGMNPATGHVIVQRSTDSLAHFVAPGVGDGMIFVPTLGGVEAFRTVS
jgi:outer membrane protein assembly factor BamB